MGSITRRVLLAAMAGGVLLAAQVPVAAQVRRGPLAQRRAERQEQRREARQERRKIQQAGPKKEANGPAPRKPGPHAGDWLRSNKDLPPDQQERALRNDPQFKKLPPQKQEQLQQRLQRFNG